MDNVEVFYRGRQLSHSLSLSHSVENRFRVQLLVISFALFQKQINTGICSTA